MAAMLSQIKMITVNIRCSRLYSMYNCNQYTILRLYPLPYLCQTKDNLGINMNRIMYVSLNQGTLHCLPDCNSQQNMCQNSRTHFWTSRLAMTKLIVNRICVTSHYSLAVWQYVA
jgi:hypothetical protein